MGAKPLNRSSANHPVHLGNENMETLLRNTYCSMACFAKRTQSVVIRFLWKGSQPGKVTRVASPLKELVTNSDPTVHQGRPGQGWYQCNLIYHTSMLSPQQWLIKFIVIGTVPNFTDRVVAVTQMRWFRRVCLVTWECRAALPLQH